MADTAKSTTREPPLTNDHRNEAQARRNDEIVRKESSAQYKSSIDKINRSQDRDIERALRHYRG